MSFGLYYLSTEPPHLPYDGWASKTIVRDWETDNWVSFSCQVTREIEIGLNDWNFTRSINIGTTPPADNDVSFSEELRVGSLDLSYSLKIFLGSQKSRNYPL